MWRTVGALYVGDQGLSTAGATGDAVVTVPHSDGATRLQIAIQPPVGGGHFG